ncbi:RDD family protein [Actinomyces oricola]|uniref:RDD family protein n=1 Tax=Actinomyces oricola TaxID=206043 RepID=UPI000FFF3A6A|nr:RDD family protein [Actinomyces oricola]
MVNHIDSSSERMIERDLMVTGEAVALEVVPASVGVRIISGLIDYTLYSICLALTVLTFAALVDRFDLQVSGAMAATMVALFFFTWVVLIPLTVEVLTRGRSAGRLVAGSRVVRDDGGPVRLRHCLVRVLASAVEVWFFQGMIAVATCAITRRGKRLGDLMAGTYVVRDRAAGHASPPLLMPPELAEWAQGADLRALPGNLALVGRTFLQRASSLRPDARDRLGRYLAGQALACVSPPPPLGTHPERLLAAVLTERRNRELLLEQRDRQADQRAAAQFARPPFGVRAPGS